MFGRYKVSALQIAKFLSFIASPVWTLIILGFFVTTSLKLSLEVFLASLIFFCIIPGIVPVVAYFRGTINDLNVPDRQGRNFFYTVFILSSIMGLVCLEVISASQETIRIGFLSVILVSITMTINAIFVKVSIHCLAYSALLSFLILCLEGDLSFIAGMILAIGLLPVAWSRTKLKKHTLIECILGILLGFAFSISAQSILS